MSRDPAGDPAASPPLAVIAALGVEHAALARASGRRPIPGIEIVQSGPGERRAERAARDAIARGARALVSWGLAGGLAPHLDAGAIVAPREVIDSGGRAFAVTADWHAALVAAIGDREVAGLRSILTVTAALESPRAKQAAALATGAEAADMESGAIARAALESGVPFTVVRVIVDTAADSLPPDAEHWIDARGERRIAPVVGAAFHPAQWSALWHLARRYGAARRSLERLASVLLPQRFAVGAHAAVRRTG
jgi:adenosylhomocysteine nucleosidase